MSRPWPMACTSTEWRTAKACRLPNRLVEKLKTVAAREGKTEYQTIVKAWIEERLQKESKFARRGFRGALSAVSRRWDAAERVREKRKLRKLAVEDRESALGTL